MPALDPADGFALYPGAKLGGATTSEAPESTVTDRVCFGAITLSHARNNNASPLQQGRAAPLDASCVRRR